MTNWQPALRVRRTTAAGSLCRAATGLGAAGARKMRLDVVCRPQTLHARLRDPGRAPSLGNSIGPAWWAATRPYPTPPPQAATTLTPAAQCIVQPGETLGQEALTPTVRRRPYIPSRAAICPCVRPLARNRMISACCRSRTAIVVARIRCCSSCLGSVQCDLATNHQTPRNGGRARNIEPAVVKLFPRYYTRRLPPLAQLAPPG